MPHFTQAKEAAEELREAEFKSDCERNSRVQNRYDELMTIGSHGHYETMFRIVKEEIRRAKVSV